MAHKKSKISNELSVSGKINAEHFLAIEDEISTQSALSLKTNAIQIDGVLYLGRGDEEQNQAYAERLNFSSADSKANPLWIERYNYTVDRSALRINIGNNEMAATDQFEVGATFFENNHFHQWLTVKDGLTSVNGNLQASSRLIAETLDVTKLTLSSIKPRSEAPSNARIVSLLVDANTGEIYYE